MLYHVGQQAQLWFGLIRAISLASFSMSSLRLVGKFTWNVLSLSLNRALWGFQGFWCFITEPRFKLLHFISAYVCWARCSSGCSLFTTDLKQTSEQLYLNCLNQTQMGFFLIIRWFLKELGCSGGGGLLGIPIKAIKREHNANAH